VIVRSALVSLLDPKPHHVYAVAAHITVAHPNQHAHLGVRVVPLALPLERQLVRGLHVDEVGVGDHLKPAATARGDHMPQAGELALLPQRLELLTVVPCDAQAHRERDAVIIGGVLGQVRRDAGEEAPDLVHGPLVGPRVLDNGQHARIERNSVRLLLP